MSNIKENVQLNNVSPGKSDISKPKKVEEKKADDGGIDVGRLDMKVGLIRTAKKHPDADSLYVEDFFQGVTFQTAFTA